MILSDVPETKFDNLIRDQEHSDGAYDLSKSKGLTR